MPRPRTCPNCGLEIPSETGFSFDKRVNLICDACGKIAFLTYDDLQSSTAIVPQHKTETIGEPIGFRQNIGGQAPQIPRPQITQNPETIGELTGFRPKICGKH